jgi:hypothetical protein
MNSIVKPLTSLLIVLLLSSLFVLTITPTNVWAVSKPSVPQFNVQIINRPYDVPPISSTNPYTGEITTQPGHRVDNNKSIEVSIKNQRFTPYTANVNEYNLYYRVEYKGHFEERWQLFDDPYQSNSQYTVVSKMLSDYPSGTQLDFRVQAIIGHLEYGRFALIGVPSFVTDAYGDWSKVQTFSIKDEDAWPPPPAQTTNTSSVPFATSDNNQSQRPDFVFQSVFLLWLGALLFAGVAIAVVVMFTKKHLKTSNYNNNHLTNNNTTYLF